MVCPTTCLVGAASLCMVAAQNSTIPPSSSPRNPMLQLSTDESFHFEILRTLSLSVTEGADLGEVLVAAQQIKGSDFVRATTRPSTPSRELVDKQGQAIDGNRLPRIFPGDAPQAPAAARPLSRGTASSRFPAIFYSTGKPGRHPTILMCNGFDGSQEEMFHIFGRAALDRGYNVITYEGPGQPTVRREQNIGFIPDWERSLGTIGYSLGGYLASRAAAFEPRIAAVGAIDGVYDFGAAFTSQLPPIAKRWLKNGNRKEFNNLFAQAHGRWSFKADDFFDFATLVQRYTLDGVADKIKQPIFVGDAELDQFFPGQAQKLADAATSSSNKVIHYFKAANGAGEHCSVGAAVYQNQVVYDWFEDIFHGES
ncbi:hypothetical protein MY11210_006397 [Beauveria gryllotalpidicola]